MALHIKLLELNHGSAPIDVLDRVSFTKDQLVDALPELVARVGGDVIISTCSRTEIYTVSENPDEAIRQRDLERAAKDA